MSSAFDEAANEGESHSIKIDVNHIDSITNISNLLLKVDTNIKTINQITNNKRLTDEKKYNKISQLLEENDSLLKSTENFLHHANLMNNNEKTVNRINSDYNELQLKQVKLIKEIQILKFNIESRSEEIVSNPMTNSNKLNKNNATKTKSNKNNSNNISDISVAEEPSSDNNPNERSNSFVVYNGKEAVKFKTVETFDESKLIDQRVQDTQDIAIKTQQLNELFKDVNKLVEQQGGDVHVIVDNIDTAQEITKKGLQHLNQASEKQKSRGYCICIFGIVIVLVILIHNYSF